MKRKIAQFFFLWVTVVIPIFYENYYFDLLEAKAHCYIAGAIPLLLLTAGCVIANRFQIFTHQSDIRFSVTDGAILTFGGVALVSCFCAEDLAAAFWGSEGWQLGAFTICSLVCFYFVLSRWTVYSQNLWLPALLVNAVLFAIAILHSAKVDVLGMHTGILQTQYFDYLSTIGNANWFAGYLCLLLPFLLVSYLNADDRASTILYLVVLALGVFCLVICASDSIYLGLGFCAFFALPYVLAARERLARCGLLLALYGAALLTVGGAPAFAEKAADMEGISAFMLNLPAALAVTGAGLSVFLLLRFTKLPYGQRQYRFLTILLESGLAATALAFLAHSAATFSDTWGTNRGRIWRVSVEIFQRFGWKDKLLGIGPELLGRYYQQYDFSRTVLVAHSDFFQVLLSMGLIGAACWLVGWGSLMVRFFREKLWKSDALLFFLPLMAYFGQSLVCTSMTTNASLLCVMAGMFCHQRSDMTIKAQEGFIE
jgi:hypothetical protein